jgi:hypothetical protein
MFLLLYFARGASCSMFPGMALLRHSDCSYNDKVLFSVTEAIGKIELSPLRLPNLLQQSSHLELKQNLTSVFVIQIWSI